jgi:hypothetical protein
MESKKKDNLLKFLYYVEGVQVAGFGFIVSKLIDLEYNEINYLLIAALLFLMISILIILIFIVGNISEYDKKKYSSKFLRRLTGFLGVITGIIFFCIICWLLFYKNYMTL